MRTETMRGMVMYGVVLMMTGGMLHAAEQSRAPLGSASFQPSSENPVGWLGDRTARYPGATPPVEWSYTEKTNRSP